MANPKSTVAVAKLSGSDLQTLLTSNPQLLLTLGPEVEEYFGKPIKAAADKVALKLTLSAPGSWKTSTGIGFSLKATAACKVSVGAKSLCMKVAKAIDSDDTQDIYGQAPAGNVYVNIELDCDIQGNVSASGKVGAIGIAGKASGTGGATFVYCHPVPGDTETHDAITAAFQGLKLPFQPDSVTGLPIGAITNVKVDATFGLELDVSYGLGKYTVAAPGLTAVAKSLQISAKKFTPPTISSEAGVKASFTYKHAEHYEAIVGRASAMRGTLLLSRSSSDETDESIGISAGVTFTSDPTGSVDLVKLASSINGVTGSGGEQASGAGSDLQASSVAKSSSWLTGRGDESAKKKADPGSVCLTDALAQQRSRAVLYEFSADLTTAALAQQSWSAFAQGDLATAMRIGGLTLLPGSGVSDCLKRSNAIHLQFFNLFSATDTNTYFKNTYVSVAADGSLRYSFDIGDESKAQIRQALQQTRFHFMATGADNEGAVGAAEVDLHVEMTETGKLHVSNLIVDSLAAVATTQQQAQLRQFLHDRPKGTLNVQFQYAPTSYGKIQSQDAINWTAFQSAAVRIMGVSLASGLSYDDWSLFNRYCLEGTNPNTGQPRRPAPDRTQPGNPTNVPDSFYSSRGLVREAAQYFLWASAQFMNLCADLVALADSGLAASATQPTWNELVGNVAELVQKDVSADWSVAAASAIQALCGSTAKAATLQQQKDKMICMAKFS